MSESAALGRTVQLNPPMHGKTRPNCLWARRMRRSTGSWRPFTRRQRPAGNGARSGARPRRTCSPGRAGALWLSSGPIPV